MSVYVLAKHTELSQMPHWYSENSNICFNVWNHRDTCQGCPGMWQPYIHSCPRFAVSFHVAERHILIICSLSPFQNLHAYPYVLLLLPPTSSPSFLSAEKSYYFLTADLRPLTPFQTQVRAINGLVKRGLVWGSPHIMFLTSLGVFCDLNEL